MNMRKTTYAELVVVFALIAAACGGADAVTTTTIPDTTGSTGEGGPVGFTPGDLIAIDVSQVGADVDAEDLDAVVASDTAFGLDLFGVIAGDENVMVSPYSIATALSMLYPGARGVTADEIARVLHLSVDDATLHAVRNAIDTRIAETPPPMGEGDTRAPFTIRPANSAWGQGGYPFLEPYLRTLAENYGAGLRVVDYVGDPEGSRQIMNAWVEDATEGRIEDLIPEGAITVDTRLSLVNAIWFKANWFEPFDPDRTEVGTFTMLDGTEIETPLMRANLQTGYAVSDSFEAVRLPYAGDAAMVILLPEEGSPADLAGVLDVADLDIAWQQRSVDITLPSFEFESEISLKPALQTLGMVAAFEQPVGDGADFTGITEVRELFVTDAFHKTFIALDEEGTEAAAATAIVVGLTAAPEPATFTADQPFLFWIEQGSTGEMLFLGQVTDPS
jgi:serpin B